MKRVIRSDVEGSRRRARERRHQERYAKRHGYFWLPCDLCADPFGGHEAGGELNGSVICPSCTAERQMAAERKLRALGEDWGVQTSRWGFPGVIAHEPTNAQVRDTFVVEVSPR